MKEDSFDYRFIRSISNQVLRCPFSKAFNSINNDAFPAQFSVKTVNPGLKLMVILSIMAKFWIVIDDSITSILASYFINKSSMLDYILFNTLTFPCST